MVTVYVGWYNYIVTIQCLIVRELYTKPLVCSTHCMCPAYAPIAINISPHYPGQPGSGGDLTSVFGPVTGEFDPIINACHI